MNRDGRRRKPRKTTPKVRDGLVQKKNLDRFSAQQGWVLERERPRRGFRHVVSQRNVRDYVDMIPDWEAHAVGLDSIRLCRGSDSLDGAYDFFRRESTGCIQLMAWRKELWLELQADYVDSHAESPDRSGTRILPPRGKIESPVRSGTRFLPPRGKIEAPDRFGTRMLPPNGKIWRQVPSGTRILPPRGGI